MLKLLIQRSEIAAGTRGSSLGPDAVKLASFNSGSDLFKRYNPEEIPDWNESLFHPTDTPHALRIKEVYATWEAQSESVSKTLQKGQTPIVISGDHASAGGTIAGIKTAFPDKRLGVVWIDAHGDLHSPYTTPSGNVHGMPLAATLGVDNDEVGHNDVGIDTVTIWNGMKNLGRISPKVQPEDLVFVGVRDTEEPEDHLLERLSIKNYVVAEVSEMGAQNVGAEILSRLEDCDIIYVSFDVDSMDPEVVSFGTGTPVPEGLSPTQVTDLLAVLLASPKICCFEMVEVNPLLDNKKNKMAETALEVLESAINTLEGK